MIDYVILDGMLISWYKKLEEKIALSMRNEGFESYTVTLEINQKESIQSKSFTITSMETVEVETASFRVFYNKRYYSFLVTGFEFLEDEIKNLKNVFATLEENDYYEESTIYHSPVKVEVHKYLPTLSEMEEKISTLQNIIREYPGFNEEFVIFYGMKQESFTFNSAGYENHTITRHSLFYLGLCYVYEDKDGNSLQEAEWDHVVLTEHMDLRKVVESLVDDIKKYIVQKSIPIGDYKVILHRNIASSLLHMILEAVFGNSIWHKSSFLKKEDINTTLFSNKLTIIEDPMMHGSIYNSPVDDSGIPIVKKYIINQGILESLLLNREYALKLQMQPTGNSWSGAIGYTNIYVEPGQYSYEELVKNMNTGIVVKSLLGDGFDSATGEISVSVKGFYIENGIFQGTVHGTINGNIFEILKDISVANDIVYDQAANSPSIELSTMKFAPSSAVHG